MIQALMVMMAIVLGFATIDLAWLIVKDVIQPPLFLLSIDQLLEIFGLFMLVLIGIELLETIIKTYQTQGQPLLAPSAWGAIHCLCWEKAMSFEDGYD
jgi:uncharacterized membrane protein (DUF373 family)